MEISEVKRSVTLTNEQWRNVVVCIAQVQSVYSEHQKYWKQLHFGTSPEEIMKREEAESIAKDYGDAIEMLEEIRMAIGGDVSNGKENI